MKLLLSILFLSGFWCKQPISAASADAGTPGRWEPAGPLLDILRYTHTPSDHYDPDENMEAYFAHMDREGKPRVLIVGCGHYDREVKAAMDCSWLKEDHIHPDAWCVDIEDPNKFDPMVSIYKRDGFSPDYKDRLKKMKANDCLDITTTRFPQNYVGKFDIVVLERIFSKPLSNPYTYYNAAQALRPEGYLFIEFGPGYGVGDPYFVDIASFAVDILKVIKPSLEEGIGVWDSSIPRRESEPEDIERAMKYCTSIYGGKTLGVSFSLSNEVSALQLNLFLRYLFFDAVATTGITSPFSGRHSSFVLARKTTLTQELLTRYTADEASTANSNRYHEDSELPWSLELAGGKLVNLTITLNPLLDAIRAVYPRGKD